jgi:hypothetical protein
MLFQQAAEALIAGKYLARQTWESTGEYVILLPGMQYIWKILTVPTPNCGNWMPLMADFLADDWKVVEKLDAVAQIAV